jgi:ubiquitin-conjugating enzyme E2 variant
MQAPDQLLARHDEVRPHTRVLEVASLLGAAALLVWHLVRFAAVPDLLAWWLPVALLAGVLAADFASGLVHWFADTWGSETMPVLGRRLLRPFRVHHVNPDDFLRRNFIDCNGDVALLTSLFLLVALLIPLTTEFGRVAAVLVVAFCAAGLPTNQLHQWAHMTDAPWPVAWLQRWGLILSYEQHQRHHAAPYVRNYCIATGWCNRPLTALGFFPALERLITRLTGLQPRSDDQAFATACNGAGLWAEEGKAP